MSKDAVEIRETVMTELKAVLADSGREVPEIDDQTKLNSSLGMTSLNLAILVTTLEEKLGTQSELVAITSLRTVGDLIEAYVRCVNGEVDDKGSAQLAEAARRAKARLS